MANQKNKKDLSIPKIEEIDKYHKRGQKRRFVLRWIYTGPNKNYKEWHRKYKTEKAALQSKEDWEKFNFTQRFNWPPNDGNWKVELIK